MVIKVYEAAIAKLLHPVGHALGNDVVVDIDLKHKSTKNELGAKLQI